MCSPRFDAALCKAVQFPAWWLIGYGFCTCTDICWLWSCLGLQNFSYWKKFRGQCHENHCIWFVSSEVFKYFSDETYLSSFSQFHHLLRLGTEISFEWWRVLQPRYHLHICCICKTQKIKLSFVCFYLNMLVFWG